MNQQSRGFKVVAILLAIVAVVAGAIYITEKDRQEKVQEEKRIQLQKEKEQAIREHQEAERKAEEEKQRKQQEIINRTENAKRNRLDPAKANWMIILSGEIAREKMNIWADGNLNNVYINEDGNFMTLYASNHEGITYDIHGNTKRHDEYDYLVFVLEIDVKNNRQRVKEWYQYNVATAIRTPIDREIKKMLVDSGLGNWENLNERTPEYYEWIKNDYNKFYKLGT